MIELAVSTRYARALFNVASEDNKLKEYFDEVKSFWDILNTNPDIYRFITLPIYPKRDRGEVLEELLNRVNPSPPVREFIKILFENDRIPNLPYIIDHYQKLLDEKEGIKRGIVFSPFPLDKNIEEKLSKKLAEYLGVKKVILSFSEDKELIGGLRVKIGDLVIDGSLKGQLSILKEKLLEG